MPPPWVIYIFLKHVFLNLGSQDNQGGKAHLLDAHSSCYRFWNEIWVFSCLFHLTQSGIQGHDRSLYEKWLRAEYPMCVFPGAHNTSIVLHRPFHKHTSACMTYTQLCALTAYAHGSCVVFWGKIWGWTQRDPRKRWFFYSVEVKIKLKQERKGNLNIA